VSSHSRKVQVTELTSSRRADAWLSQRFRQWSRSQMAREIQAGRVRSSRRELKPSTLLQPGEILEITIPGIGPRTPPPPVPPVVYEDDRLLVLNKPPGFLCHPAGDRWEWGIIGRVRESRPEDRIELAHRLDRETSGILVLTKDLPANVFLKEQLRQRTEALRKEYLAIVHGTPEWSEIEVEAPIHDQIESEVRLRRGVMEGGLHAHTGFNLREKLAGMSLVSCHLYTGRTHQIRVHLDHIGHPILGDKLYGQPDQVFLDWLSHRDVSDVSKETDNPRFRAIREAVGFPRQALHAWRMQLPHPNGHILDLEAPLPADMQAIVDGAVPCWPAPDPCPTVSNETS
jgi:23S rRNA pseudouridine1911/1915/1917 synthase